MKYLSVCSGVEAASQAWEPIGWEPVAFSEIEPFPCAVLASRFPNVPNLGDMSKIHYNYAKKELTNGTTRLLCPDGIDLIVGGTPCQSFSVAGKRAGLEGASGLAYHYARLLGEIRPRWFVWENVPGSLSSVTYGDQRDFNFLLQQFSIGGNADLGLRWNCCWRVLDTQYVRVDQFPRAIPQRRRRVFVVGHLATDCGGGCEVLLEPEGVRGNPAPRRVKGQGAARDTEAGAGGADGEKRGVDLYNHQMTNDVGAQLTAERGAVAGHSGPSVVESYGINPQNGSLMVPCTKEVGQTNAVGHENGVAIMSIGLNAWQGTHSVDCAVEHSIQLAVKHEAGVAIKNDAVAIRTANEGCLTSGITTQSHNVYGEDGAMGCLPSSGRQKGHEGHDCSSICVRTANGVECLTPSADHPQSHRVYGVNGAYPAMTCNGGKAGQDQSAICVRTANTHANGCKAIQMAYKLGLDAKLFHGAAGSTASTEMTNVKDVTLNLESGEADITTRAAEGWRISAATLKEASLEFEMIWDTSDSGFKAIKEAFFNNSAIALFASDGDGNGLDADFVVSSFSRSEPLEEALTVSVTCKPTLVTRAPAWRDGGGSYILDMQGGKIGANFTIGDGAVPAITRGRGSADDVHSIAIGIDPYNSASTGDVAMTVHGTKQDAEHMPAVAVGTFCDTGHGDYWSETEASGTIRSEGENRPSRPSNVVAIGIGRDAFNSGKHAHMAQSFSTEVQPPITANGPGGVCTKGEPRTGRM